MADVKCLPGMEGGPVFDRDACLTGILTRPLRQKGCNTEIQLVITWDALASACSELQKDSQRAGAREKHNKHFSRPQKTSSSSINECRRPFRHAPKHPASHWLSESPFEKAITSIVLVTIGDDAWASGIILNKHGLVLTNSHLLEPWRFGKTSFLSSSNETTVPLPMSIPDIFVGDEHKLSSSGSSYENYKRICVRLNHTEPWIWSDAKAVYVSKGPMDVALLQLDSVPDQLCTITPDFGCPSPGSEVHVIGHGLFGPRSDICPYVSSGVVAKVVRTPRPFLLNDPVSDTEERCSPVMLETTAAVYPGMSGGAVVNSDGRMIGLVTSNVKHAGGTTIPHLNFSIPCAALEPIFKFADKHDDLSILKILERPNVFLSSVWALMPPPPSPRPPSILDKKNEEGKGSRFAKFLAEKHVEVNLPKDQNVPLSVKGKLSNNMPFSKL